MFSLIHIHIGVALEEVTVKQLGIKNLDMDKLLKEKIPETLFDVNLIKPSDYEKVCVVSIFLINLLFSD